MLLQGIGIEYAEYRRLIGPCAYLGKSNLEGRTAGFTPLGTHTPHTPSEARNLGMSTPPPTQP